MITRRMTLACALSLLTFGGTLSASAKPRVYANSSTKVAINGYDPVGYFTQNKPVEGNAEISTQWNDAVWYFSSEENKMKFTAAPEKYAPQYGGYCAFAVSLGSTASTVPEAWSIVDGKLYLNYSLGVRTRWKTDIPGNIEKADNNWPGVLN